jgi:uracil-DNA glycosylase family 4
MQLTRRQRRALGLMGIDCWKLRSAPAPSVPAASDDGGVAGVPTAPPPTGVADDAGTVGQLAPASLDWPALAASVAACEACELHRTRTQTVFGVGNQQADWLFIGEAPGAEEDRRGEPFVGRAGQLLNAMLKATGRDRAAVYIANVLKCRPPRNRDPSDDEAARCAPYLARQIHLIAPRVIIALGRIAAQRLLRTDTPIGKLRGRVHQYQPGDDPSVTVPLIVTYHPAYLLRSPQEKRKAWDDLRLIMQVCP